jgi:hypothetical protein
MGVMECTGSVTFGGFLFEAVTVDMTTADGHQWHFKGYAAEIGTANVGHGSNFSGDFPGLDHIDGACWFEVAAAGVGGGGAVINFHDSHGEIGSLEGAVFPAGGFTAALGGGSWDDEEWQALKNREEGNVSGIDRDYAESAE